MTTRRRTPTRPNRSQTAVWSMLTAIGRLFGLKPKPGVSLGVLVSHWQHVEQLADSNDPHQLQSALFEADKVLDEALRLLRLPGETLGERLQNARLRFPSNSSYQAAWAGHKLRNRLAHELGSAPAVELTDGISQFRLALRSLGLTI